MVFLCIWLFRLNLVWTCLKLFCQHLSLNRDHFLINYQIFIIMLISFPSKSDNVSTVCTLTLQAAISFFQAFCIELNRPRNICPSLKGKFFSLTDRYIIAYRTRMSSRIFNGGKRTRADFCFIKTVAQICYGKQLFCTYHSKTKYYRQESHFRIIIKWGESWDGRKPLSPVTMSYFESSGNKRRSRIILIFFDWTLMNYATKL
jgi:hypothetical protein